MAAQTKVMNNKKKNTFIEFWKVNPIWCFFPFRLKKEAQLASAPPYSVKNYGDELKKDPQVCNVTLKK